MKRYRLNQQVRIRPDAPVLRGCLVTIRRIFQERGETLYLCATASGKDARCKAAWFASPDAPAPTGDPHGDYTITLSAAAEELGVSPGSVAGAYHRGALHAMKINGRLYTTRQGLDDYKRRQERRAS